MTVSLLTHGWICYAYRTIIRRYILPLKVYIKNCQSIALKVLDISKLNLNISRIINKNINLKLTPKNINIKKSSIVNIGVNKCSQDS